MVVRERCVGVDDFSTYRLGSIAATRSPRLGDSGFDPALTTLFSSYRMVMIVRWRGGVCECVINFRIGGVAVALPSVGVLVPCKL